jgi:hypothetical protein
LRDETICSEIVIPADSWATGPDKAGWLRQQEKIA